MLGKAYWYVLLVEPKAGRQHERYFLLSDQRVDNVEEARDTVRVVRSNRDKGGVDARREAGRILDV